jgi:transposase-like protein
VKDMTDSNGEIKRQHSAEFKTTVALELLKELDTLPKIASKYGIHPTQARRWREIAQEGLKNIFTGKPPDAQVAEKDKRIEELTTLIGQKEIELDWVKKKARLFNH